jgi:hypothetical protein
LCLFESDSRGVSLPGSQPLGKSAYRGVSLSGSQPLGKSAYRGVSLSGSQPAGCLYVGGVRLECVCLSQPAGCLYVGCGGIGCEFEKSLDMIAEYNTFNAKNENSRQVGWQSGYGGYECLGIWCYVNGILTLILKNEIIFTIDSFLFIL